jgi:hypothetical protein
MTTLPTDLRQRIEDANREAVNRVLAADPVLVDIAPAGDVVEGLGEGVILHSGPPISWNRMCGAMRGALIGQVLFEGWARTPEEATALLASGQIILKPNHHHHGAYCRFAEGRQQFGDFSPGALQILESWRDLYAPAIRAGLRRAGGLPLKPIIGRALQMGDELHNRPVAASSLFLNQIAPAMVEAGVPTSELVTTFRQLARDEFVFLGISMAAAKSAVEPAEGVAYSTMVTAMARNGTEFGIRVSGLGPAWFVAPAPPVTGLFLPGFTEADAGLDMGDSAITETVGWGGFVLAGAPGILSLVGGTMRDALAYSQQMREITIAASPDYRIPALDFAGAPTGIDIRKVVHTGIAPIIDTAIAHREPGHPKIGAGLVRAPLECFTQALVAFGERYGL